MSSYVCASPGGTYDQYPDDDLPPDLDADLEPIYKAEDENVGLYKASTVRSNPRRVRSKEQSPEVLLVRTLTLLSNSHTSFPLATLQSHLDCIM